MPVRASLGKGGSKVAASASVLSLFVPNGLGRLWPMISSSKRTLLSLA
jgi:hypothetical protein